ncbi:TetR/AcrR family transcriptional regulator [Actinomadura sp. CNU-125]|uniref:TetR/AcrR family transcriptional regulator n=1 Tax=Actinomadura sp. CNU-125 TaxID=1904961 RepID=UPI000AAABFA9|nr:TetR/AcrR family transcriptional regulator [Actinomadura sp. CNU-125]
MDPVENRRRAPGMSPERRREMIVRAALPLVGEHGSAVTTGRIARAAGIGEATIFRVFADKDELLDACVAEALRPDRVVAEIAAIAPDAPLPVRLAEAARAMEAHLTRIGLVLGALHATGRRAAAAAARTTAPAGPPKAPRAPRPAPPPPIATRPSAVTPLSVETPPPTATRPPVATRPLIAVRPRTAARPPNATRLRIARGPPSPSCSSPSATGSACRPNRRPTCSWA